MTTAISLTDALPTAAIQSTKMWVRFDPTDPLTRSNLELKNAEAASQLDKVNRSYRLIGIQKAHPLHLAWLCRQAIISHSLKTAGEPTAFGALEELAGAAGETVLMLIAPYLRGAKKMSESAVSYLWRELQDAWDYVARFANWRPAAS